MRIAITASHAWPLPSPARTGDSQIILDLTRALAELGHDVYLFAPKGTKAPEGVRLAEMPLCSHGSATPSTIEAEAATLREHEALLLDVDVVHDCSVGKSFAEWRLSREPARAWICDAGTTLHETLPEAQDCWRTVVRLNVAGWLS